MSLKDIKRLLLFAYCGILFIACGNDDKTVGQEELKATVSGKYFLGAEEGTWLKKSGNNLYEIADPYLAGTGRSSPGHSGSPTRTRFLPRRYSANPR